MYPSEEKLVQQFLEKMIQYESWSIIGFCTEFDYSRGRTDIVIVSSDNEVIAIEAKLYKWKVALQQAYRNKCFADKSYVLLPAKKAAFAQQYSHEFNKRGVGLCSIEEESIVVLQDVEANPPIQPWLREKVLELTREAVPCPL